MKSYKRFASAVLQTPHWVRRTNRNPSIRHNQHHSSLLMVALCYGRLLFIECYDPLVVLAVWNDALVIDVSIYKHTPHFGAWGKSTILFHCNLSLYRTQKEWQSRKYNWNRSSVCFFFSRKEVFASQFFKPKEYRKSDWLSQLSFPNHRLTDDGIYVLNLPSVLCVPCCIVIQSGQMMAVPLSCGYYLLDLDFLLVTTGIEKRKACGH